MTDRRRRARLAPALLVIAALTAAGCGSGDGGAEPTTITTPDPVESVAAGAADLTLRPVLETRPASDDAGADGVDPVDPADVQSADPEVQAAVFGAYRCTQDDPLGGTADPAAPLVTCDRDGETVYLLGPAIITGDEVEEAEATYDQNVEEYLIQIQFTTEASERWSDYTRDTAGTGEQAAFVVDAVVVSAPQIIGHTPAGSRTSITGDFTEAEADQLADALTGS